MSLIAWYKFDGDPTDSSGLGRDATLYRAVSVEAQGKIDRSMLVQESASLGNGYCIIGNLGNPGKGSIAFWFKKTDATTASNSYLMDGRTTGGWWFIHGYNSAGLNFSNLVTVPYSDLSNDTWHHVVVTANANETKIYLDGVLKDTGPGHVINFGSVYLGTRYTLQFEYINGNFDDVRFYDHVLNQREVSELVKAKSLHYKFDDYKEYTYNYAPAMQRTCQVSFTHQISHITTNVTYTLETGTHNRSDVTKVSSAVTNQGTYPDFGFSLDRNSTTGDTYVVSFDYKMLAGSETPRLVTVYKDGYKSPDASNVATFGTAVTTDLKHGWVRYEVPITITNGGDTYLRFGNDTTYTLNEYVVDNFQVELSKSKATPFADGVRTDKVIDSSGFVDLAELDANTPTWAEDSRIGQGVYNFNGSNYINLPQDVNFSSTGDWTFCCWIKLSNASKYVHITGVSAMHGSGWTPLSHFGVYEQKLSWWDSNGRTQGTTTLVNNEWYFVAIKSTNNSVTMYVNGNSEGTGVTPLNNVARIGAIGYRRHQATPDRHFEGEIDDVRLYCTALSTSELDEVYKTRASLDSTGDFYSQAFSEASDTGISLNVISAGYDDGNVGYIYVNGVNYSTSVRGINVVRLDRSFNYQGSSWYDTHLGTGYGNENGDIFTSGNASTALLNFIDSVADGQYLLFAAKDAHTNGLSSDVQMKLDILGSEYSYSMGHRSSWVFIVQKKGQVIYEQYTPQFQGMAEFDFTMPSNFNVEHTGITKVAQFSEVGPTIGLIGWWPLDGNTRDYVEGNDGTAFGGPVISSGNGQASYLFDGVDDYISANTTLVPKITATISAWINISSLVNCAIVTQRASNHSRGLTISATNNTISFFSRNSSGTWQEITYPLPQTNRWYHLAGTQDGQDLAFYVDGVLVGTLTMSGYLTAYTDYFVIGDYTDANFKFNGKIQQVRAYDAALSKEDVEILYKLTNPSDTSRMMHSTYDKLFLKSKMIEV